MSLLSRGTVTVTGKINAAQTITAGVYTDITEFGFDIVNNLFWFVKDAERMAFEISAATTVTVVLSGAGGNYTITVS